MGAVEVVLAVVVMDLGTVAVMVVVSLVVAVVVDEQECQQQQHSLSTLILAYTNYMGTRRSPNADPTCIGFVRLILIILSPEQSYYSRLWWEL